MNSSLRAIAVTVALAIPSLSFAQSNQPLTRTEVRAQLVQLEQAGYRPAPGQNPHYPDDIQAAEARVAVQAQTIGNVSGYGTPSTGSLESGSRNAVAQGGVTSLYKGH
ncbi:DUF4148 domain-containing protein [Paraburkholderia phosphatilytica]|uniref:DUF4148 domain-containing protein n=1 Tax=Paraburkholderia phosphatilytica TaxID=2282883 RepID=UPI000E502677|nr:DUF4148 domain-containing protein [Paraburkholderia phosphatilytica]